MFSNKRKKKIRKNNYRKISKYCGNMIGLCVDGNPILDQAIINHTHYLLVELDQEYAIYKIVKIREYVKLSAKRVLEKQKYFSNHAYWKHNSHIKIATDGAIESVEVGTFLGPASNASNPIAIYIIGLH